MRAKEYVSGPRPSLPQHQNRMYNSSEGREQRIHSSIGREQRRTNITNSSNIKGQRHINLGNSSGRRRQPHRDVGNSYNGRGAGRQQPIYAGNRDGEFVAEHEYLNTGVGQHLPPDQLQALAAKNGLSLEEFLMSLNAPGQREAMLRNYTPRRLSKSIYLEDEYDYPPSHRHFALRGRSPAKRRLSLPAGMRLCKERAPDTDPLAAGGDEDDGWDSDDDAWLYQKVPSKEDASTNMETSENGDTEASADASSATGTLLSGLSLS